MISRRSPSARAGRGVYLLLLSGIVCFVIAHGHTVDRRLRHLDQVVVGAATAEAFQTHARVPRFLSPQALDSFLWVDHARGLANTGTWRLRATRFDNAPDGRPVRWSSGLAWWLMGLGRIWADVHDAGIEEGIERAGVWACPILFLGCVALLSGIAMRYGGVLAAATMAVALLASGDVYGGFLPGEPDHHGLAAVCALGTLFGLTIAIADPRAARFGVVLSALAGATGLWISAITQSFTFVFIGIGILCVLAWLHYRRPGVDGRLGSAAGAHGDSSGESRQPREEETSRQVHPGDHVVPGLFDPATWRLWGRIGALASIVFYVFESVSDAVSWHVEVNHPLYAIAWLAGAEMLAMWSEAGPRFRTAKLGACAMFVISPALAILTLGEQAHAMRDPFLAALHARISELQPISDVLRVGDASVLQAFGILPLAAIGAIVALRWEISTRQRITLLLCLIPLAVATVLRVYQVRWGVIWGGLAVAMAAVTLPILAKTIRERWGRRAWSVLVGIALLVALAGPLSILRGEIQHAEMGEELTLAELRALLLRDVALLLGADEDAHCVLAGPESSVLLSYFGGIPSIGTLYWENVEGLRAAAEIATARTNEEALRLATERRLTHIVLTEWEDFASRYDAVLRPESPARSTSEIFAHRIAEPGGRPHWLREVPYPELPQATSLGLRVRVFQVSDD